LKEGKIIESSRRETNKPERSTGTGKTKREHVRISNKREAAFPKKESKRVDGRGGGPKFRETCCSKKRVGTYKKILRNGRAPAEKLGGGPGKKVFSAVGKQPMKKKRVGGRLGIR